MAQNVFCIVYCSLSQAIIIVHLIFFIITQTFIFSSLFFPSNLMTCISYEKSPTVRDGEERVQLYNLKRSYQ